MPFDKKRFTGPERSKSYSLFGPTEVSNPITSLFVNNRRKDGRKWDELRRIFLKHDVVTKAKGSAYMELGNTKVVCSVFDPREVPRSSKFSLSGKIYCRFKYAPYACKTRQGYRPNGREKEASHILRRSLESAVNRHMFPSYQIDVYVLVLEDSGSVLAAAITCAGIALANASVPMFDLVVGVTAGVCGAHTLLDLTTEEEEYCNAMQDTAPANNGVFMASYMATQQQVTGLTHIGAVSADCLKKTVEILVKACEIVYPLSQQCIIKGVQEHISSKDKELTSDI